MTLCDILLSLGSAIYNAGCALIRYCYLKNSLRVELQVRIIIIYNLFIYLFIEGYLMVIYALIQCIFHHLHDC